MNQHDENIEVMKDLRKKLDDVINREESDTKSTTVSYPNALWHLRVSLAKSVIRIFAGVALAMGALLWAGSLLILAEMLGVAEEIV